MTFFKLKKKYMDQSDVSRGEEQVLFEIHASKSLIDIMWSQEKKMKRKRKYKRWMVAKFA